MKKKFMMLLPLLLGVTAVLIGSPFAMAEATVGAADSGVHAVNETATVQRAKEVASDLIVNEIDRIVTKIRPQSNPLVMIAMRASATTSNTQVFNFYENDTLPIQTQIKTKFSTADQDQAELETKNNDIFSEFETIMFPDIDGWDESGQKKTPNCPLQAYIVGKTPSGNITCKVINGKKHSTSDKIVFPVIEANTKIVRAGRAHNEDAIQTSPYANYPKKKEQFIQKFKCQVEETTAMAIANKEANFTLSDIEEDAIFDMTRTMSVSLLLGAKRRLFDKEKKEVYFTGGIIPMFGKHFVYGKVGNPDFTKQNFIDLQKESFVGSNGSKRKTMICGSEILANLSLLQLDNDVEVTTTERFDLTFHTMRTNFGVFDVIYDENMDTIGKADCAMIIDENFIRRKDYKGVKETQDLDLRSSGQRDVDAKVITRAFALYLQNPNTHIFVSPAKA